MNVVNGRWVILFSEIIVLHRRFLVCQYEFDTGVVNSNVCQHRSLSLDCIYKHTHIIHILSQFLLLFSLYINICTYIYCNHYQLVKNINGYYNVESWILVIIQSVVSHDDWLHQLELLIILVMWKFPIRLNSFEHSIFRTYLT